jgi:hypothetical protein
VEDEIILQDRRFVPFDKLKPGEKLAKARADLELSVGADEAFQKAAQEDFAFHAGHQYTREEISKLEKQGRPVLVFNLCRSAVDLVTGVYDQNRVDAKAQPTETSDAFLADLLNTLRDKCRQIENAEAQEDEALEDMTICGRGFTAVDFYPDAKHPGEIRIPVYEIPTHEIRLDPAGREDDLSDHRFIFWDKWLSINDFAIQYPHKVKEIEKIFSDPGNLGDLATLSTDPGDVWSVDTSSDYTASLEGSFYDVEKGLVRVIHMEYWANYTRYYGIHPKTGKLEEFEKKNLKILKQMIPGFEFQAAQDRKVRWFQFTGRTVLFDEDSPIPFEGFSICPCFCYKDKSGKLITHFGVVRGMKDPQREVNKRWSQMLNLLMAQTQGGRFAEIDAPLDKVQWEESINETGETTWLNPDALGKGKIQEKPLPQLPVAAMQIQDAAQEMLKKISGINPDLLGMDRGRQEPGVVVKLRQQQGLTLLSKLFKAYKMMKKGVAERMHSIICAYMPESQMQRILGTGRYVFQGDMIIDQEKGLQAPIRALRDLKYNIEIEESAANMSRTMAQLAIFMDMMAKGFPTDPNVVIDRLDLPETDKIEWKQYIQQSQESQAQAAQAEQEMKAQELQLKAQEMQGRMQESQMKAQMDMEAGQAKLGVEQARVETERAKLGIEQAKIQQAGEKIQSDREIGLMKIQQEEMADQRGYVIDLASLDLEQRKLVTGMVQQMTKERMQPETTK